MQKLSLKETKYVSGGNAILLPLGPLVVAAGLSSQQPSSSDSTVKTCKVNEE